MSDSTRSHMSCRSLRCRESTGPIGAGSAPAPGRSERSKSSGEQRSRSWDSAKKTVLFEEAFAIRLARELQPVIEQHPVLTAYCGQFVKPTRQFDGATLTLMEAPTRSAAGASLIVTLAIGNVGTTSWPTAPGAGQVRLGVQLLTGDGSVIDRDYARHALSAPVDPGGRCKLTVPVVLPTEAGPYKLKFDLVREGVAWFELAGSAPVVHDIDVT